MGEKLRQTKEAGKEGMSKEGGSKQNEAPCVWHVPSVCVCVCETQSISRRSKETWRAAESANG